MNSFRASKIALKMICRGQKTNAHGKMPLCRVSKEALGKDAFCRVPKNKLGKMPLCRVSKKGTRQRRILPSAEKWHSAKYIFAEYLKNTRQNHFCRVPKKTLGRAVFAECPLKNTRQSFRHSAKCRFPLVYIILNQE